MLIGFIIMVALFAAYWYWAAKGVEKDGRMYYGDQNARDEVKQSIIESRTDD